MIHDIRPISEKDIRGFHKALDEVARERKFLSFLEAVPLEQMRQFVLTNIKNGYPEFVAVVDEKVVGWCDVIPNLRRVVYRHSGTLGVGLLPQYRGMGIGRQLMRHTLDAAFEFGLSRIELTVRENNVDAISLYKSCGFEIEGLHQKAVCIDGIYENMFSMALLA